MRIHHLNCGTMCPLGGRLMDGTSPGLAARLVCHCLLIETNDGLVLVDTGLGLRDVSDPHRRLSGAFRRLMRLPLRVEETAVKQIQRLGFRAADVRHIVLTHLDFDHAGGLSDFPAATVHVTADEERAVRVRHTGIDRGRYRPRQWGDRAAWCKYEVQGDRWFGFEAVRELRGLPPEILMVPLVGHTWGHAGVAVDTGSGWLLNAGDAYFYRGEMDPQQPHCTPGLRAYQRMMEVDRRLRLYNQDRLRDLVRQHGSEVQVFSAHDPVEFQRLRDVGVLPRRFEEPVGGPAPQIF